MTNPRGQRGERSSEKVAALIRQIDEAGMELRQLGESGVQLPETLADGFLRIAPVDNESPRLYWELGERIKELQALHALASLTREESGATGTLLEQVVPIIIEGFQDPEHTAVSIRCGRHRYESPGFDPDAPVLKATFDCDCGETGCLLVARIAFDAAGGAEPFLEEERHLVASVGEILHLHLGGLRAMAELVERERQYRLLFKSNPHPMWVYDKKTLRFLDVNESALKHYGYSRERFLAMTIADIRPPEDVAALRQEVSRSPPGYSSSGVWRHCLSNGEIIQVEISSHEVVYEGHEAELILALDVTERLRAENELRDRESLLALAQEVGQIGSWRDEIASGKLT